MKIDKVKIEWDSDWKEEHEHLQSKMLSEDNYLNDKNIEEVEER